MGTGPVRSHTGPARLPCVVSARSRFACTRGCSLTSLLWSSQTQILALLNFTCLKNDKEIKTFGERIVQHQVKIARPLPTHPTQPPTQRTDRQSAAGGQTDGTGRNLTASSPQRGRQSKCEGWISVCLEFRFVFCEKQSAFFVLRGSISCSSGRVLYT